MIIRQWNDQTSLYQLTFFIITEEFNSYLKKFMKTSCVCDNFSDMNTIEISNSRACNKFRYEN